MHPLLAAETLAAPQAAVWPSMVIAAILVVVAVLLVGLVLNVNKLLRRATNIQKRLDESEQSGVRAQMQEAIVQLQSMAVSLDRVAMRCDAIDAKVGEAATRGAGGGDAGLAQAVASLRDGLDQLKAPIVEMRDLMGKSEVEKLSDEVKRTLYSMGYDQVVIRTDLATIGAGEGKVYVEVSRTGVKSKGHLVVRAGNVIDTKISPTYEMFP